MKRIILLALLTIALPQVVPSVAQAGPLQRACMNSDRQAANRQLCRCIQNAARGTLNSSDQRLAASFFRDPHRSQEIRQSDRVSHESFWKRYREFGTKAQQMCS